jgi:hypothetical protein
MPINGFATGAQLPQRKQNGSTSKIIVANIPIP